MRCIMRFALPCCTPTLDEAATICLAASGNSNDAEVRLRRLVVRCGVSPDFVDDGAVTGRKNKWAPLLFIAARRGLIGTVAILLAAGADVDKARRGGPAVTALFIAAQNGHVDVVHALLTAGADVEKGETSPLVVAAEKSRSHIISLLLDAGANVDAATDARGITPLYIAAQKGHTAVVEQLIAAGASVNKNRTDIDASPLWVASLEGAHVCMCVCAR